MDQPQNLVATIDAWRECGAHRFDPVRFRFIEALARRAAAHDGHVRRILDDKVARLLGTYGDELERARCAAADIGNSAASPCETTPGVQANRGPLAELVDYLARHAPSSEDGRPELRTLRHFRSTWSRLSAHHRLRQSLAQVPKNAGPLNSHHLVHRSLTLMRDLSPEYLDRFMSYVDALLWLDQANAPRGDSDRKAGRGKAG